MQDIRFHSEIVLRSPAFPFYENISDEELVKNIARNKEFKEAIYIASPVLFDEMTTWLNGEIKQEKEIKKVIYSLHKYFSRISTRSTPYGLFANCSTGHWGITNSVIISKAKSIHARLDMDFVCKLSQYIYRHPAIRTHLLFYPNNSIYYVGDQIRVVQYNYLQNKRVHNITSAHTSTLLLKVIESAKNGALVSQMYNTLLEENITPEEGNRFLKELIDAQILVSEIEPNVTGKEFIHELTDVLEKIKLNASSEEINFIIQALKETNSTLESIELNAENHVDIYRLLFKRLQESFPELKEGNLFQVDSFRSVAKADINEEIKNTLSKAINFIHKLSNPVVNTNLSEFKKRFNESYEGREIPLLWALDTETGIGYPSKDAVGVNELIDNLAIRNLSVEYHIKWNAKEELLLKKLVDSAKVGAYSINFVDGDIKGFQPENAILPATMSTLFKIIDNDNCKIQYMYATGSSAANILGRFAHGDKNISILLKEIANFEKDVFNDKIVAEIVHLSENRVGNILLRPIFREYEIPYLAKSTLSPEYQIPLDDILVSIKNNRIFLRSKKLNKEILPRLSTAHNYTSNSLPAYMFLGDMQTQDISLPSLIFSWGSLARNFKFIPRAVYDKIILHPATWSFLKSDYETLLKNIYLDNLMDLVVTWKKEWKMPRYISLKDADNELLIDLESELSVKVFLDTVKHRTSIELVEFLFDPKTSLVRDEEGNPYNHEIIAILFNEDYKKSAPRIPMIQKSPRGLEQINIKRNFITGSEWLYYKIYCGVKTMDKILVEVIKPLTEYLKREKLIEKWFFIRYSDPDIHLRLRFFNNDFNKISEISKIVYRFLNPLLEQGILSKVLTDTYKRELERYGINNMEISEKYFEIESDSTLNLLSFAEREKNEDIKWLYAVQSTDFLFDSFGLNLEEKLRHIESLRDAYFREHGGQKDLKLQLDDKFRKLRPQLEDFLKGKSDNDIGLYEITSLLKLKRDRIKLIASKTLELKKGGELEVEVPELLTSYSHMSLNRIFKAKQRTYEMVIYDMLYRFYKSQIARKKAIAVT